MNVSSLVLRPIIKLMAWIRLPKVDGELKISGLEGPVEILRDRWGVPHIYANNLSDLLFAQGFVHAQERFWQMEFQRRLIAGRLSEILGAVTLPLDRWMRTLTLQRVADFEVSLLNEQTKGYLLNYANGVNVFLKRKKLPVEISLLKYQPEPWKTADTLGWIKMMAWSLSVNWEAELLRAQLISRLGPEKAAELEAPHLARWPYILPPGLDYSRLDFDLLNRVNQTRPFSGPSPYAGLGSNNWALSGSLTQSGMPILANDMHLGMAVPAVWFENHLCAGDIALSGVTFPGIPGVVAGHNGHVAWGFTNGFPDVQDLYIERLRRLETGEVETEYNGHWEKAQVLHEKIAVHGAAPVDHEVIVTRHGPIITELAPDLCDDQPLALRWTALDPDDMVQTLFEITRAKNNEDFKAGLRFWATPAQNIVYADRSGNIGYTLAGKIPLRKKGRGRTPVPGWSDEYEWSSYLPFEALPDLQNPSQGYVVTANNRVFDASYPIDLELEPISGDRAQRITEMILDPNLRPASDKIDLEFIQQMQFDQCSPSARSIVKILSSLQLPDSAHNEETEAHKILDRMRRWDGTLGKDSPEAAIYQVFIRKMIALMLTERLDPQPGDPETASDPAVSTPAEQPKPALELTERFMGKGPTPVLAPASLFGERWLPWLNDQLAKPDSPWFDFGSDPNRDALILTALEQAIQELKERFGPSPQSWSWGKIHQLNLSHPLGSNPLLGSIFNLGPYPIGGDHTTVWASGASFHNLDTSLIIGPVYRMIIDLADLDKSLSVLAPGQSGNPASPHYADQVSAWFNAKYHPMLFSRPAVEKFTAHRFVMKPAAGARKRKV
ncbi:MAG: penicillin acylase family protein [Anaerolineae bacterium]|nr:penicillin acylase family protein [Anaerolineae bacterium]